MADGGLKPINEVTLNDAVMAWHRPEGVTRPQRVTRVHRHEVGTSLVLKLGNGRTIITTNEHRFFVKHLGFTAARDLRPGASLASAAESHVLSVEGVEVRVGPCAVFNLSVANDCTYFVGADSLLVHNDKKATGPEDPDDTGE